MHRWGLAWLPAWSSRKVSSTVIGRTGPYEPERGHRYNANKLLLDPYARKLAGSLRWSDALFGYRLHSARADLSFDRRDSAFAMPKAVVTVDKFDWGNDRAPRTPWRYTSIYELHVKGFTKLLPSIRERDRGSFAALASQAAVDYLRRSGHHRGRVDADSRIPG